MNSWNSTKATETPQEGKKRWQKLLELPESTEFYDLSTGKTYTRKRLRPLYKTEISNMVDTFKDLMTEEEVYVPFIRVKRNGNLEVI